MNVDRGEWPARAPEHVAYGARAEAVKHKTVGLCLNARCHSLRGPWSKERGRE